MTYASPHAASAANRGILRKNAILLVSVILAKGGALFLPPAHLTLIKSGEPKCSESLPRRLPCTGKASAKKSSFHSNKTTGTKYYAKSDDTICMRGVRVHLAQVAGALPRLRKFNTLVEEPIAPALPSSKKQTMRTAISRALPLSQVKYEKYERVSSGIAELDVAAGRRHRARLARLGRRRSRHRKIHPLDAGRGASVQGAYRFIPLRRGELLAGKTALRTAGAQLRQPAPAQ